MGRTVAGTAGVAVVAALLAFAPPRPAHACSGLGLSAHVTDPDEVGVDTTAPGAVQVTDIRVYRGVDRGRCEYDSCDDIGTIALTVTASDDRTPLDQLGYRLTVIDGALPDGLDIPAYPVNSEPGALYLVWVDGATDFQESFAFTLEITAVDLAGNEGPSIRIEIADGGSCGCRTAGRNSELLAQLLLVMAVAAFLRRRRRPTAESRSPRG